MVRRGQLDLEKPTQMEWLRKRQWKYPKIEAEQLAEGKKEGEGRDNPKRSPQIRPLHINCMFFPRSLEWQETEGVTKEEAVEVAKEEVNHLAEQQRKEREREKKNVSQ